MSDLHRRHNFPPSLHHHPVPGLFLPSPGWPPTPHPRQNTTIPSLPHFSTPQSRPRSVDHIRRQDRSVVRLTKLFSTISNPHFPCAWPTDNLSAYQLNISPGRCWRTWRANYDHDLTDRRIVNSPLYPLTDIRDFLHSIICSPVPPSNAPTPHTGLFLRPASSLHPQRLISPHSNTEW